jgi:hypothetical protein
MAKLNLYSIYDSKVKFYDRPMVFRNRGEALRAWEQAANDEKATISTHPADYALMEIGEFDDQNGKITCHPVPESLGLAVEFKRLPPPAPLFDANQNQG